MTSTPQGIPGTARLTDPDWWIRDRHGNVVVAQPPNTAIIVWLAARLLGRTRVVGDHGDVLDRVGQGALTVWAVDELVRGASPVRRLMGAVVLPGVLWRVLR